VVSLLICFFYLKAKKMKNIITFFTCILLTFSSSLKAQTYYEAEDGVLYGVASIQDCGNCSGGKQVGDLGYDRYFTYDVTVAQAGTYKLKFGYASAQDRSIFISVNDGLPAQSLCNNNEWSTKSDKEIEVELMAGVNTIKFFNNYGWAPGIDGFSLEYQPGTAMHYEAETGSTLFGVASIQDCGSCSGGQQVGDLGYDRYMTYDVSVPETGTYNLKLFFNSGDQRSVFISANGSGSVEVPCLTGDWGLYANQDVSIDLVSGVNTLKFYNDNGWAPNIDAFSLILTERNASTYYEAEDGVLYGVASIQDCGNCSGGKQVSDLGYDRYFTYGVTVAQAGTYKLKFGYASAQDRSIFISVNDGLPAQSLCNNNEWSTKSDKEIEVELMAGVNTIKFFNNYGWAPGIDGFSLEYQPGTAMHYEAETGSTLFGVASIQDCGSCSGGQQVGDLGYDRYMTYDVSVPETGTYNLKLFFNSGDQRSVFISANGSGSVEVPCLTGDWGLYANQDVSIDLVSGVNTLKFYNDNGWAPNIDAFSLMLNQQNMGGCVDCNIFTYGNDSKIAYDIMTGTFDVFQQDNLMIQESYSEVSDANGTFSSKDYSQRTVSQSSFSDDIGSGNKVVVSLTGNNLPNMQQIFYIYDGKPYFLMEVMVEGQALESNYMAPLISSQVNIDTIGDNRVLFVPYDNDAFVRYQSIPMTNNASNVSSEVTAFYENNSRHGFIAGSVEHSTWKTGVETTGTGNALSKFRIWGGYTSQSVTRDELAHGKIKGNSLKSPKVFIGFYDDWRLGMEDYATATNEAEPRYISDWNQGTPIGWNSWGVIADKLTFDKAISVVDFFANEIPMYRNEGTAFLDLDSFWDNMVTGGLEGDFSKLNEFVQYCKTNNLKPGIYWTPFVDWGNWDRRIEGSTYNYQSAWTKVNGGYHDFDGGRAMDPTHPGTKERIDYVINKFKESGFEMIKLDFLGHGAVEADEFYDTNVTTGMEAYKEGMEYLLDKIGNDMLVYSAISPSIATSKYSHVRRIACDAWDNIGSSEYTLNSNTYGWWQSKMYDYIDADHIVFGSVTPGENRARLASGIVNGSFLNGDDFSTDGPWVGTAKNLLQNQKLLDLIKNGKAFVPVEGNTDQSASELFGSEENGKFYLIVFNYGQEGKSYNISLDRLGLNAGGYCVGELFSGNRFSLTSNNLNVNIGAKDAAIYEFNEGENSCVFSLPDNYKILSTDASCNGNADGNISIDFKSTEYTYNVQFGDEAPIVLPANTDHYDFTDLSAGVYNICFTIDEVPWYKQCFEITIDEPGTISVVSKYDDKKGIVNINLEGAERFYVNLNGNEQLYKAGNYKLNAKNGLNQLSVKGDLVCQGTYTEKFYLSQDIRIYPNPTSDKVQIDIPTTDQNVMVDVYDLQGRLLKSYNKKVIASKIELNLGDVYSGAYLIHVSSNEINETVKVYKK
jgi:alpha-galactosidase